MILVIGGGKMGLSHLAIASALIGKGNVALCDTSWLQRRAFAGMGYRCFHDFAQARQSLGPIAGAVIAAPTRSHYVITRSVLDQNIPCFVEKPLTLSPKASAELVDLARSRGVDGQMGLVLRYNAAFLALRAVVRNGDLGAVRGYSATMTGNVITEHSKPSWRSDHARGGGVLNEYGPHVFDLCRFIFGDVAEIGDVTAARVHSARAEDRLDLAWTHPGAIAGNLALNWCDPTRRKSEIRFDVRFAHARMICDGVTLSAAATQTPFPSPVAFYLRGEEYTLQLEAFIGKCLNRTLHQTPHPEVAATLQDGLEVDRLIDAVARKGGLK